MAHIIVVGNEKGGAGKSTVSMHVAVALARMGHRVNALDLDLRQQTLGTYITNRQRYLEKTGLDLPAPASITCPRSMPPRWRRARISMTASCPPPSPRWSTAAISS
jgi:chromosome partitioning protein